MWISVGCPLFSLLKMPKGKVQFVPLKEVFDDWRKFRKGDRGLVLVKDQNGLRIERSDRLNGEPKIFLGKIKKPTLRVGFLNACLAKICPCDPERIQIPLLSRLKMEGIEKEFQLMNRLERKVRRLSVGIDLRIAKTL